MIIAEIKTELYVSIAFFIIIKKILNSHLKKNLKSSIIISQLLRILLCEFSYSNRILFLKMLL